MDEANRNSHAVFLLDTSLSSQPDKFNIWLDLLRATLDNNRDSLRQFAVLFFNVENHFWQEQYVEITPENVRRLVVDCQQLVLEGATDLDAAAQAVADASWIKGSRPDLFLLSDGAANWGETNLASLTSGCNEAMKQELSRSLLVPSSIRRSPADFTDKWRSDSWKVWARTCSMLPRPMLVTFGSRARLAPC